MTTLKRIVAAAALFELANRVKGLTGRYTLDWGYNCRYQGRFAGVSNTP